MTTLDYVTPKTQSANPGPAKAMVAIAWACWLVPLGCGLFALAGFAASGFGFFLGLGVLTLMAGGVAALAGLILSVLTYSFSARVEPETRSRLRGRASVALVGILVNFPIALTCIVFGVNLPGRIYFNVHNEGTTEVTEVCVDLLGRQEHIGRIKPNETWRVSRRGAAVQRHHHVDSWGHEVHSQPNVGRRHLLGRRSRH